MEAVTHAVNTINSPVDIIVLVDKVRTRHAILADRHNAQLVERCADTRGQRYNACANRTQASTLVFIDPLVELPAGWLAWAERAMFERAWDAVALTMISTTKLPWLTRFLSSGSDTLALSVKRQWFERVGGFDVEREQGIESDLLLRLAACNARVMHRAPEVSQATSSELRQ
ncbi:hypothetical protein [Halomonas sp. M20]|uniref:hypothetical protein n=1 Tax=Halomonas sp. M20 TaxID=2763264 RepID=UPI001D09D566|nr:hypothetical protein [Halomonas sp. M20]